MNLYFSSKVCVYYDFFVNEIMLIGVVGIDVVGGLVKLYYIKVGDVVVYKVKKNVYDEEC